MSKSILFLLISLIIYLNFTPSHAGIVSHSQIMDARLQVQEFFNERKECQLKNFRIETLYRIKDVPTQGDHWFAGVSVLDGGSCMASKSEI